MSEVSPSVAKKALKDFLRAPFLLFSTTLLLGAVLMLIILTPSRFPVQTGERVVHFGDVTRERDALRSEHQRLLDEQSRIASLTPTPTLNLIHGSEGSRSQVTVKGLTAFEDAAESFDASLLVDFLRVQGSTLSVSGRMQSSEDRSIQLLASFIDRLRESDAFVSVSEPEYRQVREQDGRTVAPFAINIVLAP